MAKRLFFLLLITFLLTSCGRTQSTDTFTDDIVREENSHTFIGYPVVYMSADISSQGLLAVYDALDASCGGNVALKLPDNAIEADKFTADLAETLLSAVDGAAPIQGSAAIGTTIPFDVDTLDEDAAVSLAVKNGDVLKETYIGDHFLTYDYLIVLSHFQLHDELGIDGALQNISYGLASSEGKNWIASGGISLTDPVDEELSAYQYAISEAGSAVVDELDGRVLYISVVDDESLSRLPSSSGNVSGILASYDPVALDMACIDLMIHSEQGEEVQRYISARTGFNILAHAETIGLGSCTYALVGID